MFSAKLQIGLVVVFVGGAFGVKAFMRSYQEHVEIRNQKAEVKHYEWSKDFMMQFSEACVPSAIEEGSKLIVKQMPTLNPGGEIRLAAEFAKSYCSCLGVLIEKERVIITHFNPNEKSAVVHANELRASLSNFMITVKASQLMSSCREKGLIAASAVR